MAKRDEPVTDQFLVESVLSPSKTIRKGYESVVALTAEGKTITGLLVKEDDETIVIEKEDTQFGEGGQGLNWPLKYPKFVGGVPAHAQSSRLVWQISSIRCSLI